MTRQTWGLDGPAYLAEAGQRAQGAAQLDRRLGLEAFCGYQLSCVCSRQEAVLVVCKHIQFQQLVRSVSCCLLRCSSNQPATASASQVLSCSAEAGACRPCWHILLGTPEPAMLAHPFPRRAQTAPSMSQRWQVKFWLLWRPSAAVTGLSPAGSATLNTLKVPAPTRLREVLPSAAREGPNMTCQPDSAWSGPVCS